MSLIAVTADTQGGVCAPPTNDAPPASNLILDSYQPTLMCSGRKANYVCNAGGLNILAVSVDIQQNFTDKTRSSSRTIHQNPRTMLLVIMESMTILQLGLNAWIGWTARHLRWMTRL